MKKTWRILKTIVNEVANETSEMIMFDGLAKYGNQEIAESLNKYFVDSINELNRSIPNHDDIYTNTISNNEEFRFEKVDLLTVERLIKNIASRGDCEFITKQVLLDGITTFGLNIVDVVNSSKKSSYCPKKWKNSIIAPVPKIPGTNKCEEFRPINMLPNHEKILEAAIKEQLDYYLEINKLVIKEQSGFRKGHSCESALNMILLYWKEQLEDGKIVLAVFLDLKRAFETIDRNRLLKKQFDYGVRGKELKWFESYLESRTQCTKFNDATSERIGIDIGVPQGSKLAATLFSLYINDIKSCLIHMLIALFADDTLIYYSGNDIDEIMIKVNEDLE